MLRSRMSGTESLILILLSRCHFSLTILIMVVNMALLQALAIMEQSRQELQQAEGAVFGVQVWVFNARLVLGVLGGAEQKAARQASKKKKFKF